MADQHTFTFTRHASQLCSCTLGTFPVSVLLVLMDLSQEVVENVRRCRSIESHGPSCSPSQGTTNCGSSICSHVLRPAHYLRSAIWVGPVPELQGDRLAW